MAVARKQTIPTAEWVELLIAANVTDPQRWPSGTQHGAELLHRIRAIEAECIEQHGRWTAELLGEEAEDHYDDLCAQLDQLRRELNPEPPIPFVRSASR